MPPSSPASHRTVSCSTRAPSSPTRFRLPSGSSAPRSMADAGRRAAFLDRDGTILEDPGFLHQPGKARLLPGAGAAVRRLNDAGVLVVTVSDHAVRPRGPYADQHCAAMRRRPAELLAT